MNQTYQVYRDNDAVYQVLVYFRDGRVLVSGHHTWSQAIRYMLENLGIWKAEGAVEWELAQ